MNFIVWKLDNIIDSVPPGVQITEICLQEHEFDELCDFYKTLQRQRAPRSRKRYDWDKLTYGGVRIKPLRKKKGPE